MPTLTVKTGWRTQLLDVSAQVQRAVAATKIAHGICYRYAPHPTAVMAIHEGADPDVAGDVEGAGPMNPSRGRCRHAEGNSDSHGKTVISGTGLNTFAQGGIWSWDDGRACSFANMTGLVSGSC